MGPLDFQTLQTRLGSMTSEQMAEKLMAQNPNLDPTALLAQAPGGTGLGLKPGGGLGLQPTMTPMGLSPAPLDAMGEAAAKAPVAGGPNPFMMMGAQMALQGMQKPQQAPTPQHLRFGAAAPAKNMLPVPGMPQVSSMSLGQLMEARKRS